jgi:hypothetical protein
MTQRCESNSAVRTHSDIGPHDIRMEGAWAARLDGGPILETGREVGGVIEGCHFQFGFFTPRLFRRRRLQRFASLAARCHAVRAYDRWVQTQMDGRQ